MKQQYLLTFFLSLLFIGFAFLFREKLAALYTFGLLGIFLINFFGNATIFLPAPAIVSVVVGGALYPPFAVAIVSALGASSGDMVGFLLGHSGKNIFFKDRHRLYESLHKVFKHFTIAIIFLFAFIPNPFFDIVGILAGAFSFPASRFFLALFLGRLLRSILLSYAGHALM